VTAVETVGQDAAREEQHHLRQAPRDADGGERRRRVRQVVCLPRDRDDVDAVPHERDGHSGPEKSEVPNAERPEDPDAIHDRRGAAPEAEAFEQGWTAHARQHTSGAGRPGDRASPVRFAYARRFRRSSEGR
jgi:hypothetical protein